MPKILTACGQISCPHGGVISLNCLKGASNRTVSGVATMTAAHLGSIPFPCPALSPCTAVIGWNAHQSLLKIDGVPVLTESATPITNNGAGRVVEAGQSLCKLG